MQLLISTCPRCKAVHSTFDARQHQFRGYEIEPNTWLETFAVCRICGCGSIFASKVKSQYFSSFANLLESGSKALSQFQAPMNVYCSNTAVVTAAEIQTPVPPADVPPHITDAFIEAMKTFNVGCFNASAAMSRLTLDLVTKNLLPSPESAAGITKHVTENLKARTAWLLSNGKIPQSLAGLASNVRLDGNEGAHSGGLSEVEAADLIDFTRELLETCFTVPARVLAVEQRRKLRKDTAK